MTSNLQVVTPQFERVDEISVAKFPNFTNWEILPKLTHEQLVEMGIGVWDTTEKYTHYLFPKEWYSLIPKGLKVKCISGKEFKFKPGITDDDYRFGFLSFGFIKSKEQLPEQISE